VRHAMWILALAILLAAPLFQVQRLFNVRFEVQRAEARLEQVELDARRIVELRDLREVAALGERPKEDVIARVNAALGDAGLPLRHFGDLREESDARLANAGDVGYRKQSLSLSLNELTVPDLGAFLQAWRRADTPWTITRLTLTHPRSRGERLDRYEVSLILSALYVGDDAP